MILQKNMKDYNPKWPQNIDHPHRILVIRGSGSGKTNDLFNLIKQQEDDGYSVIDNINFYVKDPNEPKNYNLIKKRENTGFRNLYDLRALIEYWITCRKSTKIYKNNIHKIYLKTSERNGLKTTSKRVIQKAAEATDDLTGNKIGNKITKVSRTLPQNSSRTVTNETENIGIDRKMLKERYISPEK